MSAALKLKRTHTVGNYTLRDYQSDAIKKIFEHFKSADSSTPITLGVAPSGGKTVTSIAVCEQYLDRGLGKRVLVLTHGQAILRTQFYKDIVDVQPDFTSELFQSGNKISDAQVIIALPQSIRNRKKFPKIDLMVVDEAHQYYFANMVQDLVKYFKPKHQLLLTGTPSPMVKAGMPLIVTPLSKIVDDGLASDLRILLVKTPYKFTQANYNSDHELMTTVTFSKSDTIKALKKVAEKLLHRQTNQTWKDLIQKHRKVMIACRTQDQAATVHAYLKSQKIDAALSTSFIDPNSAQIERFRRDPECRVLIVVVRGVLGFNMLDLEVVIDMTASQSIDRIYQLMTRVVRKSSQELPKFFVKISSKEMFDYMGYVMSAVGCMTTEWITKFNGDNFYDLPIPVKPNYGNTPSRDYEEGDGAPSTDLVYDINGMGPPLVEIFSKLFTTKDHSTTSLGKMRKVFFGTKEFLPDITIEDVEFMAKTGKSYIERER